jgi:hypothetical protein
MRYLLLLLLNLPVILLALVNIITQYKLRHIARRRFWRQVFLWAGILAVLTGSFPIYNLLVGRPPLDSAELSSFDIIQTTAVIALIYVANHQRQKIEKTERMLRDLHQELSIILSKNSDKR